MCVIFGTLNAYFGTIFIIFGTKYTYFGTTYAIFHIFAKRNKYTNKETRKDYEYRSTSHYRGRFS